VVVALLSAATLAAELLLVRVFAIAYFHHFAYMVIGVAMAGLGAAGTLVAVRPPASQRVPRWLVWSAGAAALSLVAAPALVSRLALDPTRLAWAAGEWQRLALVYALLAFPFFAAALAVLLALVGSAPRPGGVYGASFLGAAAGAALGLAVLWLVPPHRAVALPATLAAAATLVAAFRGGGRGSVAPASGVAALTLAAWLTPLWRPVVTPHKALPQLEAYPGAVRTAERWSPVGWAVALDAPAFRHAPGLSLDYGGAFPRQTALLLDGDLVGAVTSWPDTARARAFTTALPVSLPHALATAATVLVLGAGGGLEIESALAHGADRVVAVELSAELVRLARTRATMRADPHADRVRWVVGDARSVVARSHERFDLITLAAGAGGPGGTAAGVYATSEDFLHTVEAYQAYLRVLSPGGVLAITGWMNLPPRAPLRTIFTAAEALRRERPAAVSTGIVVARSWGTATVLVRPGGFAAGEVARLRGWADTHQLDLDWYPGLERPPEQRFHRLDAPTLFHAAHAAVSGPVAARRFAATYPFDVTAVTDARPFPQQFLRLRGLPAFFAAGRGQWLAFAEWGYVALVATLVQSLVLGAAMLAVPLAGRRAARDRPGAALLGYFGAIGLAYLAAEIAAIQQLHLLLGHPVYAVSATLVAVLVASGAGSVWSDRVAATRAPLLLAGLAALLVACALGLLPAAHALQRAPLVARAVAGGVAVAVPAFLMGLPFPLGLRALAGGGEGGGRIAWAWAANGYASVVAAPLATLLALEAGSRVLFVFAAALYLVAGEMVRRGARSGIRTARGERP